MSRPLDELLSQQQLRDVICCFYDGVYSDPMLAPLFTGVDQRKQEERLFRFVLMTAVPNNDRIDGRFLRMAHDHLALNPALLARRWEHLVSAISACGHGPDVVAAWNSYEARFRDWVLSSVDA